MRSIFSDGDNLPSDNDLCLELVQRQLEAVTIKDKGEVYPSLKAFFSRRDGPLD